MVYKYLEELDLQAAGVVYIQHEETLSSAVFKIDLKDQQTAILKIFHNRDRYRRERYFLENLKSQFPVPKILKSVEPSLELEGAILMEYLNGSLLSQSKLTVDMAFEMGALLATLHLVSAKKYGDLSLEGKSGDPFRELELDFQESMNECREILPFDLLSKAEDYFSAHLPLSKQLDGPCIVHRDFKPGNIIVENGKIVGVIDWELARGSFAEEDFVRMDRLIWAHNDESKEPFFSGYKSVRHLPHVEELLPFLRFLRSLGAIGFTIRRNTWQSDHKSVFEFNKSFLEHLLLSPK